MHQKLDEILAHVHAHVTFFWYLCTHLPIGKVGIGKVHNIKNQVGTCT